MSRLYIAPIIPKEYYKYYFALLWLSIGLISSVDLYWCIKNQHIIAQIEENPIGRYLIELDQGDVALFMGISGVAIYKIGRFFSPPIFAFFTNHPQLIPLQYKRYMENNIRDNFGFVGVPIKISFRMSR